MTTAATVTIQIGNSDDKLTQKEWSCFVRDVRAHIQENCETHFDGGSRGDARWQNHCWVVAVPVDLIAALKVILFGIRRNYGQESVAFTVGETFFV